MKIERTDSVGAQAHREVVLGLYREVFGEQDPARWTDEVWNRHRTRADFRLITAFDGQALAGFAWGYTGERGQYWADRMSDALGSGADDWIGGHFELVELAVAATARRRGLGRRLHDAVLAGLPHDRAILCTSTSSTDPAVRLYESRGWRTLGRMGPATRIMGLRHPASAAG